MKNKKGVSALVVTVLLILISLSAVGIIWGAIMPIISDVTKNHQNQTLNQTEKIFPLTQQVIDKCKKNCEDLTLFYVKVLEGIPPNMGYGCYCRSPNSYGTIILRIW
jgi:hypothetical protein